MRIGLSEFIFICILAVALIKPEKLSHYAKELGKVVKVVLKETKDLKSEMTEVTKPIQDVCDEVNECIQEIKEEV